jgi:hypothetical protein
MSMSRSGPAFASLRGFGVTLPGGWATSTSKGGAPVGARIAGAERRMLARAR